VLCDSTWSGFCSLSCYFTLSGLHLLVKYYYVLLFLFNFFYDSLLVLQGLV